MYQRILCHATFLTQTDLDKHMQASIARAKELGGKFALLARILQGDEEAERILRHLIDAGLVGPGFDHTPSEN